ncbi:MAG: alginate export family protein, partial [Nitrospirota bacterium]
MTLLTIRSVVIRCILLSLPTSAWCGSDHQGQADRPPLPVEQPNDRPPERRFGPVASRFQEIVFLDDLRLNVPQSPLHLDQLLHVPEWLHLGLDFRTRYEAYSQPVKKNETTGAAQFSERTDVNLEAHFKPFKFHVEFLDARPLYNYGLAVSSRMEDRTDVLQLYGSIGTDNFLGSGLPTDLQIGKFTQAFGKSRLIARSQYSNVPYSFVGAHWTLGTRKDWEVRAFVM